MRLTELQMTGFKSFKNSTTISFNQGITGVVGPNGCGKSNIVDAILWATGDSMASQLRGQKMDDIIFSGTQSSSPAPYAEVSLFLNKDEGEWPEKFQAVDELIIKRKVKRGGDSQYFINDQICLQRDIQEILMDTGALGFSIIKQETVTQMVSYKPDQMRALIEQAAGVAKYKNKKRLAENKLKTTCQNIQRLEDIAQEQTKQLKRLGKQAKQAQTYKDLKEKITDVELHLLKSKYEEIQNKIQEDEMSIQKCIQEEKGLRDQQKSIQKQYQKNQTDSEKIYSQLSRERNNLKTTLEELTEYEVQVKKLEAIMKSNAERSNQWKLSLSEFEDSQKSKLADIENLKKQMEKFGTQITTHTKEVENKQVQLENIQLQYDLLEKNQEDLSVQSDQALREEARLEEVTKNYEKNERQYKNIVQDLESQLKNKESRMQTLKAQCKKLNDQVEKDKVMHLNLKEELRSVKENLSSLKNSIKEEESKKTQQRLMEKESQYKSLSLLKEKTENSMKGYQWVKKEKSFKYLLEVLDVEQGYEKAVSAVLDSALYGFLVQDASLASKLVQQLKSNDIGRALFLLNRDHAPSFKKPQTRACLKDKVKVKGDFNFNFLFENIFVADSVDQMIKESQKYPEITFVTPEGDTLKHGCLLHGGTSSEDSDLIIQDKEIQKLEDEVEQLKLQFQSLENEVHQKTKELEKLEKYLGQLDKKYNEDNKNIYATSKEYDVLKRELSFLEREHQSLYQKLQKQKENRSPYGSPEDLQQQYKKAQIQKDDLQKKYEEARQQRNQCLSKKNQIKLSLDTKQVALMHLQKDLKSAQYREQLLKQSINEMNQKSLQFSEQSGQSQGSIKKNQEELENWKEKWFQKKEQYEKQVQRQDSNEEDYQEKISSYKSMEQKIASFSQDLEGILDRKHTLEIDKESNLVEKKNVEEKALENYQVSIYNVTLKELSKEDIQNLEEFKNSLSRIGQVNLLALSEYDELNQEYAGLNKQLEDLVQSKQELEQVIEEMERISSQKFKKTFKEVNQRFEQVFKSVFGGGHATFRIVDDGVEIEACPPEKKLKSLKLLSGGEKSLVAICVVFSLFLIRPAPFCVLDEVDAALDDSNIIRYNALVLEIARKSPIILITHNKHSMKNCDRLYGVTMEDKGITNLLSVEMKDYQEQQI